MSPSPLHDHHPQPKRESQSPSSSSLHGVYKINKDSHCIKKSPPSTTSVVKPRHPVIIYTHSPRVIHTHPRHFMALVQKLTGLSRSEDEQASQSNSDQANKNDDDDNKQKLMSDDNDSSSGITDENGGVGSSVVVDGQVNSCFIPPPPPPPPIFDHPHQTCFNNIPFFNPTSTDIFSPPPQFYNYTDSMFFMPPNNTTRTSLSSSPMESMKEFPEY